MLIKFLELKYGFAFNFKNKILKLNAMNIS